ncbi:MAG: putative lipoprotein NlpE involved in copper resistance, partial [Algoriphagus sp.]
MKKQTLFLILVLNSMLQSCDGESQTKENIKSEIVYAEKSIPDQEHNSMNSLDWNGTYKGVLPCASCEGIETILTLNSDQSYVLITNYLGRNDALEQEKRGEFSWNEDSSIITLTNINSG